MGVRCIPYWPCFFISSNSCYFKWLYCPNPIPETRLGDDFLLFSSGICWATPKARFCWILYYSSVSSTTISILSLFAYISWLRARVSFSNGLLELLITSLLFIPTGETLFLSMFVFWLGEFLLSGPMISSSDYDFRGGDCTAWLVRTLFLRISAC